MVANSDRANAQRDGAESMAASCAVERRDAMKF
jgi:hypothetical protein